MKYLVFSHGFGVKKDSRGMFTDIAKAFPDFKSVLFDYNDVDEATNTLTVRSLQEQAKILQSQIDTIRSTDSEAEITLICHSQGCVTAALANPKDIKQAILLTPPGKMRNDRANERLSSRPHTTKESDGTFRLERKDGSTLRLTQSFLRDLGQDPFVAYAKLAEATPTTLVVANDDETIKPVDFSSLPKSVTVLKIDGDHNFTGEARAGLITTLKGLL